LLLWPGNSQVLPILPPHYLFLEETLQVLLLFNDFLLKAVMLLAWDLSINITWWSRPLANIKNTIFSCHRSRNDSVNVIFRKIFEYNTKTNVNNSQFEVPHIMTIQIKSNVNKLLHVSFDSCQKLIFTELSCIKGKVKM
jgi:hypothetical protein